MLELLLILIAVAAGGGGSDDMANAAQAVEAEPAVDVSEAAIATTDLVAEPQVPSGQFTTAVEVKPILNATQNSWVAVREFNGQDLVYVTHLWGWRCGLVQMKFSVNGNTPEEWPLPPCHLDTASPNAIIETDGLPYRSFELGSVDSVTVEITYDDLTTDIQSFERKKVLLP